MSQPFEIEFDFPLAHSDLIVSLKASAELHHSQPYFFVHNFYTASVRSALDSPSVLPPQEIKRIKRDGRYVWVHKDSEKESVLSLAIGKGIDEALKKRK
jgi:hypothetical protein